MSKFVVVLIFLISLHMGSESDPEQTHEVYLPVVLNTQPGVIAEGPTIP